MNNFNIFQLAEIAYNAYGVNRHYRTFDNRIMPVWSELSDEIKEAWVAAITGAWLASNGGEKEIVSNENR